MFINTWIKNYRSGGSWSKVLTRRNGIIDISCWIENSITVQIIRILRNNNFIFFFVFIRGHTDFFSMAISCNKKTANKTNQWNNQCVSGKIACYATDWENNQENRWEEEASKNQNKPIQSASSFRCWFYFNYFFHEVLLFIISVYQKLSIKFDLLPYYYTRLFSIYP